MVAKSVSPASARRRCELVLAGLKMCTSACVKGIMLKGRQQPRAVTRATTMVSNEHATWKLSSSCHTRSDRRWGGGSEGLGGTRAAMAALFPAWKAEAHLIGRPPEGCTPGTAREVDVSNQRPQQAKKPCRYLHKRRGHSLS
eukprot:scaffold199137_cov32-Tisochrysis_lutea.AAC.3